MTKVCLRVPRSFMHEVLWPQVDAMGVLLEEATAAAADRIVGQWLGEPLRQHEPETERRPGQSRGDVAAERP
jgi:hypothetical protein